MRTVCIALLLALLPSGTQAHQQASPQAGSDKLASLRITGSARFRPEQIAPATGLSPGATVTKDDLQQAANRLGRLGPFSSVAYRYGSTDTGVEVEYHVTDAPAMPVWFDNFPWFTDDELIAALKSSVPLFDGRAPEQGSMLEDMSHELQSLLAMRGIVASVSHSVMTAPASDERVQQFRVDDVKLPVASVEFSDPLAQSDRGIQSRLMDIIGENYSRTGIELFEVEQVRPVYISHAFLRVRFLTPTARVVDGAGGPTVTLTVPIEPGPVFSWNGVTWTGGAALGVLELETLVPLHNGEPADGMKIEKGWQAIRNEYARRGYLSASLAISPHFDDKANRVSYAVVVTEGPQYHMGKLVLTGLSIEGERRIRAAWRIAAGEVFDKSVFDEFMSTGIKTAFVGTPANYEKIGSFLQENAGDGVVDVLIDFQ